MTIALDVPDARPVTASIAAAGTVTGTVALTLRAEAASVLAGALLAYRFFDGHWGLFALLFLVPDVGMLGYFVGPRAGAWCYNLAHTYLAPVLLALTGLAFGIDTFAGPALVWAAHIAFDRLVGYGLKYPSAFGATHLG